MPCTLECKPSVKWEVVPEIEAAQPTIDRAYADVKSKAVVTSAHDGVHSKGSAHRQNDPTAKAKAIDLRIINLYRDAQANHGIEVWYNLVREFAQRLCEILNAAKLGCNWAAVVEKDHIHLEAVLKGEAPNIVNFSPTQLVYASKDVRRYLV